MIQTTSTGQTRMESVFQNYLTMPTNYALLLNGKRGIGKTHFVKNRIIPLAQIQDVANDACKKYKVIYISLYGVKSISDIFDKMATEFLPLLKNKKVKLSVSLAKLLAKPLLAKLGAGDLEDYLKRIGEMGRDMIDTRDFVIIFDDLDRTTGLDIQELIGFINSLVEHDNNKVLIVADESSIQDRDQYASVKEKTIGTTIQYTATLEENYTNIIDTLYKPSFSSYHRLLEILKEDIVHVFRRAQTENLRTLIYLLNHLQSILAALEFTVQVKKADPADLQFRKLISIVKFSAVITIEFKSGKISYTNRCGLQDHLALNSATLQIDNVPIPGPDGNNDHVDNRPYAQQLVYRHFPSADYQFYSSIYDFLTGGDVFLPGPLMIRLKEVFDHTQWAPTPADQVFQTLTPPQVYDLSDSEYTKATEQMLEFAYKGQYPLERYFSILHYLARAPTLVVFDINVTAERIVQTARAHMANFTYDPALPHKLLVDQSDKNSKVYQSLRADLLEINKQCLLHHNLATPQEINQLYLLFTTDQEHFYAQITLHKNLIRPAFSTWNFEDFYAFFQSMRPSQLYRFSRFLKLRFSALTPVAMEDRPFIEALNNRLATQQSEHPVLRNVVLEELRLVIWHIFNRMTRYKP